MTGGEITVGGQVVAICGTVRPYGAAAVLCGFGPDHTGGHSWEQGTRRPPNIQYFDHDSTWVRPAGCIAVDVVACGAGAGSPGPGIPGEDGQLTVTRYKTLPSELRITVGNGGRPGGQAGYVLVITHLEPQ